MSRIVASQHRAVLEVLERHRVAYVLIGGVALQLHGWQGATTDVDLTVATEEANVGRLNAALAELGAREGMPGALGTTFRTSYGRVEFVRRASGVGGYEDWLPRATHVDLDGITVCVAHPEDLLRSKEAAGRGKDRDTLPAIRRDLVEAGRLDPERVAGEVAASEVPPAPYLVNELGSRPAQQRAARLWDVGAERIEEHRRRWGIGDPDNALGTGAQSDGERADRAALERTLRRTRTLIAKAIEPPSPSIDLGR